MFNTSFCFLLTYFYDNHIIMTETGFLSSKILFAHRWRLINDRFENIVRSPEASNKYPARKLSALPHGRACFIGDYNMIYQEGYVYHIKDEYFEKVQDSNLMQNKEGGTYRPTFYCLRDSKTSLLWMVPLSSHVEKYKAIHDKQVIKYGKCLTIVLGEFDGKEAAFLLQNMFPIRDYYLDHIHTRNNNPVPVKHSIHKEVTTRMKKLRQLHFKGKKVVFPNIDLLEQIMLAELKDNVAE